MEDRELLEQISKKLSVLIATVFVKDVGEMTSLERVGMLGRFGLTNQDVANILDTTKPTIEVLRSRIKKNKK